MTSLSKEKSLIDLGAVLLLLVLTGLLYCLFWSDGPGSVSYSKNIVIVSIDTTSPVFEVNERFLSVTLDTSILSKGVFQKLSRLQWKLLSFYLKALTPSYLRFGGTPADLLLYNMTRRKSSHYFNYDFNQECAYEEFDCLKTIPTSDNIYLNLRDWLKLNYFCQESNSKLIFDLNVLSRDGNEWNSTNSEELIKVSASRNFNIDWQLGNEPNSFRHVFNVSIDGYQLGKDYNKLLNVLNKYEIYKTSKILGPEVTRPQLKGNSIKYLQQFLSVANDTVSAVSWHQYYLNSRTASIGDFLDESTFNLLPSQIQMVSDTVKKYYGSNVKEIWLTETSTTYGGGAPTLSDTFVGSFLWIDKLGLSAKMGISVVMRQSLFDKVYSLIDHNFQPLPDWWISVLYKRLVGRKVLDVSYFDSKIRLYAHCSMEPGKIVVYGINIGEVEESMAFALSGIDEVETYVFTALHLQSSSVLLNEKMLVLNGTNEDFKQYFQPVITRNQFVPIPPFSVGFWVLNGQFEVCN